MAGSSEMVLDRVEATLKGRAKYLEELMDDYDPDDPDFEDSYGEGSYDRLFEEFYYIQYVLDMLKKDA